MSIKRKTLSQLLRAGATAVPVPVNGTDSTYFNVQQHGVEPPFVQADPILAIFVGKFGPDIIASILAEYRFEVYDEHRVWERAQICERLTKAVNGGVWELHQRLTTFPRLYSAIHDAGFRKPRQFTSVFTAITYLYDKAGRTPDEIAAVLEESRL